MRNRAGEEPLARRTCQANDGTDLYPRLVDNSLIDEVGRAIRSLVNFAIRTSSLNLVNCRLVMEATACCIALGLTWNSLERSKRECDGLWSRRMQILEKSSLRSGMSSTPERETWANFPGAFLGVERWSAMTTIGCRECPKGESGIDPNMGSGGTDYIPGGLLSAVVAYGIRDLESISSGVLQK